MLTMGEYYGSLCVEAAACVVFTTVTNVMQVSVGYYK